MKHRVTAFMFSVCLASSMAFADNQADAPLVVADQKPPVVHYESCAGPKGRRSHKNENSPSPNAKSENASKNNRQGV